MLHNNSSNTSLTNHQMPGGMPGAMPGSIPQEDTQFSQQEHTGLNDHSVNNFNSLGQKTSSRDQTSGLNDNIAQSSLQNSHETIPSNVDGHRSLQSHHKGLGNLGSNHGLPGATDGLGNHKLNSQQSPIGNDTQQTHFGGSISTNHNNNHHYGRDAALGAGAAGLAKHELGNHQNNTSHPLHSDHSTSGLSGHGLDSHRTDPLHSSGHDANPLRNEQLPVSETRNNGHHYGRDAALGASALGAGGLAKHELDNRHDNSNSGKHLNNSHGSNSLSHDVRNEHSPVSGAHGNERHDGRDAALGAGAAGLAKHELGKHHDNSTSENDLNNSNESNPLTHDLRTKHSPVSHTPDNEHHYGRDAALGAGAVGAGDLAKHELDNHHRDKSTSGNYLDNSYESNPLNHDSHTEHSPVSGTHDKKHHYGRDAALGAGAAGLAKHELDNHHNQTGSQHNEHSPVSENSESHRGRDAALGAGAVGIASREVKHNHDEKRNSVGSAKSGGAAAGGPKPLNTGGDAHHIAEQPMLYTDGGLTGHQPVGKVEF